MADSGASLVPVGVWVRLELPDGPLVGFTYVDAEAGFSAQGWRLVGTGLDPSSRTIARLPTIQVPWRRLTSDEAAALHLEPTPAWVGEFYGPQPSAGSLWGAWRTHPRLAGKFLPDYPDDLQVFVHDGGPRITRSRPEAVWVSLRGMERAPGVEGDVFRGRVLNQPHQLTSIRQGSEVRFLAADGAEFPVLVTDKYLQERGDWIIHPCRQCGLSELFDAPSDLIRAVFPNQPADALISMFTSFCPLCGGVQGVESLCNPAPRSAGGEAPPPAAKRPWWRFGG